MKDRAPDSPYESRFVQRTGSHEMVLMSRVGCVFLTPTAAVACRAFVLNVPTFCGGVHAYLPVYTHIPFNRTLTRDLDGNEMTNHWVSTPAAAWGRVLSAAIAGVYQVAQVIFCGPTQNNNHLAGMLKGTTSFFKENELGDGWPLRVVVPTALESTGDNRRTSTRSCGPIIMETVSPPADWLMKTSIRNPNSGNDVNTWATNCEKLPKQLDYTIPMPFTPEVRGMLRPVLEEFNRRGGIADSSPPRWISAPDVKKSQENVEW